MKTFQRTTLTNITMNLADNQELLIPVSNKCEYIGLNNKDNFSSLVKSGAFRKITDHLNNLPIDELETQMIFSETVEIGLLFHKQLDNNLKTHANIKLFLNLDFQLNRYSDNTMQLSIQRSQPKNLSEIDTSSIFKEFIKPGFPICDILNAKEGDLRAARANQFLIAYFKMMRCLSEHDYVSKNFNTLREFCELAVLKELALNPYSKHGALFTNGKPSEDIKDLRVYINSIPGIKTDLNKASEQHGFIAMQFSRFLMQCQHLLQQNSMYSLNITEIQTVEQANGAIKKISSNSNCNKISAGDLQILDGMIDSKALTSLSEAILMKIIKNEDLD